MSEVVVGNVECAASDCSNEVPPGRRKWCSDRCRNRIYQREWRRKKAKEEADAGERVECLADGCKKHVPDGRQKFCSDECAKAWHHAVRAPESTKFLNQQPDHSDDGRGSARRGHRYRQFVNAGWPQRVLDGMKNADVAEEFGCLPSDVARWMAAYREDRRKAIAASQHETPEDVRDALRDFRAFSQRYFPDLLVPDFHVEWSQAITSTLSEGGRLLLLAPQRHGKSEMLVRYCIWRICNEPDIRIIWVGATAEMAERMVGFIRQHLEHHEQLIDEVLGPADTFVPPSRSGLSWTNSELTVATRSKPLKSPTIVAVGKGGTIIGRDADLIVVDDPQDRTKSDMSPLGRQRDREWFFTDFLSRKESHTGVAYITSRQHLEDIPAAIMKDHSSDWEILIYRAHDPACTEPDWGEHEECVLWPELRDWEYLWGQKRANETHFERNYQNNPRNDATSYVTTEDLEEIKDHSRRIGDVPSGCRLIAGIDPAESKPVAAVLWGWDGTHRHVIDVMEASASVVGLREILSTWTPRYGLTTYVFEKNMSKSWLKDRDVSDYVRAHNLQIREHYTSHHNKLDDRIGPVAMFQKMRTDPPQITVPWADAETRAKVGRLLRQWLMFDPEYANSKAAQDDLTMASWFPQPVIDSWANEFVAEVQAEYHQSYSTFSRTGWRATPWSS